MENHVFAAVLLAALLHAGWNTLVKVGLDRLSTMLLLALVQAAIALPLIPFVPAPSPEAWPWIAGAAALHAGYKIFLAQAYAHADLSQAYPVARGTAPVIVLLVSATVLGARFETAAIASVGAISAGLILMAVKGGGATPLRGKGLAYALGTAGFTAGYTLVDGVGAKVADTASGFILPMVVGDAVLMCGYAVALRGGSAFRSLGSAWKSGTAAGAMSLGSYWIAVWAFTQAPIALVAALRESSILFAVLIAVLLLGERVSPWRWVSIGLIACGVALMKL
ncbi:EamA family transporter [Histidinibacterium aquaticum]|uniref:EamA family transporter n=1 Tax=Histidinibacterium aquaticum TaxID=2613962 RepID=A0A5J5GD93_9RHOB|nr:EamA family transporter [Histidinibacterium aquaticum]KAA9005997.1 EamA family transporter [Histidinibacterium aquaticum]